MDLPEIPEEIYYLVYRETGQPAHPKKAWFRRCVAVAFALGYAAGRAGEPEDPEPETVDDL